MPKARKVTQRPVRFNRRRGARMIADRPYGTGNILETDFRVFRRHLRSSEKRGRIVCILTRAPRQVPRGLAYNARLCQPCFESPPCPSSSPCAAPAPFLISVLKNCCKRPLRWVCRRQNCPANFGILPRPTRLWRRMMRRSSKPWSMRKAWPRRRFQTASISFWLRRVWARCRRGRLKPPTSRTTAASRKSAASSAAWRCGWQAV